MDDLHGLAEERSLAYHRVVAERLALRPELLVEAKRPATKWAREGHSSPYAREWLRILELPLADLASRLVDPSERGRALRQATPFAGALDPRERWKLWSDVRQRWERR